MSLHNKHSTLIPTGEAQVGRVQSPSTPAPAIDDTPTPVLEHEVQITQEADGIPAAAAEVIVAEAPAKPTEPEPTESDPEPETAPSGPEFVLSEPEATAATAPLQEFAQVPIPIRINQLHTDHQRLRNALETLERALRKPVN